MILRSRVPLQAYPTHIPSLLHKWADERPDHTWLAQRRGPDRRLAEGQLCAGTQTRWMR